MTIGQGYDTPLVYGQLSEVSFKSKLLVKSYGLDMDFDCLQCDLDLGDMTLGQDHDTSMIFGHGKQLCEIFKSNKAVRSYGPDRILAMCAL